VPGDYKNQMQFKRLFKTNHKQVMEKILQQTLYVQKKNHKLDNGQGRRLGMEEQKKSWFENVF
jgi:hypothetical protein